MSYLTKFLVALPALSATVALAQEEANQDTTTGLFSGTTGIVLGLVLLVFLWRFVFRGGGGDD